MDTTTVTFQANKRRCCTETKSKSTTNKSCGMPLFRLEDLPETKDAERIEMGDTFAPASLPLFARHAAFVGAKHTVPLCFRLADSSDLEHIQSALAEKEFDGSQQYFHQHRACFGNYVCVSDCAPYAKDPEAHRQFHKTTAGQRMCIIATPVEHPDHVLGGVACLFSNMDDSENHQNHDTCRLLYVFVRPVARRHKIASTFVQYLSQQFPDIRFASLEPLNSWEAWHTWRACGFEYFHPYTNETCSPMEIALLDAIPPGHSLKEGEIRKVLHPDVAWNRVSYGIPQTDEKWTCFRCDQEFQGLDRFVPGMQYTRKGSWSCAKCFNELHYGPSYMIRSFSGT